MRSVRVVGTLPPVDRCENVSILDRRLKNRKPCLALAQVRGEDSGIRNAGRTRGKLVENASGRGESAGEMRVRAVITDRAPQSRLSLRQPLPEPGGVCSPRLAERVRRVELREPGGQRGEGDAIFGAPARRVAHTAPVRPGGLHLDPASVDKGALRAPDSATAAAEFVGDARRSLEIDRRPPGRDPVVGGCRCDQHLEETDLRPGEADIRAGQLKHHGDVALGGSRRQDRGVARRIELRIWRGGCRKRPIFGCDRCLTLGFRMHTF